MKEEYDIEQVKRLIGETGKKLIPEYFASFVYDDLACMSFLLCDENSCKDEDEENNIIIFWLEEDEEGEDIYIPIEDAEYKYVCEEFSILFVSPSEDWVFF